MERAELRKAANTPWPARVAILGIAAGVLVAGVVARYLLDLKPVAPLTFESFAGFLPPT